MNTSAVVSWTWLLSISVLTVMKIAPEALNADVLLNSVMSLQNLTLYYWGQNRLLNVLPLAAAAVRDPTANLMLILVLTSISFYTLLYLASRAAATLVDATDVDPIATRTFLLVSSVFVLVFRPHAIAEIAIGHIEYSFAAGLLALAVLNLFTKQERIDGWTSALFPVVCLVLAIGMNPSTVIPALFIAMTFTLYRRRIASNGIVLAGVSGMAFLAWSIVSIQYGAMPYVEFNPGILPAGLGKVADGLLGTVNLPLLLILITGLSFLNGGLLIVGREMKPDRRIVVTYVAYAISLFSAGWLLLFSCSRWVELNQFAWRYFIYVIFALLFLLSVSLSHSLNRLSNRKSLALAYASTALATLSLASPVVGLHEYRVFQNVNALTEPGRHLYAGDYWVVWPSVLRDMMRGYDAFGLTYRGAANGERARNYVVGQIREEGDVLVFCLNDKVENCISQVNAIVGPLDAAESVRLKDGVHRISFVDHVEHAKESPGP